MANIIKRKVKGKYYFYLEKTVRIGTKIKKFYEYIGSKKASKKEIHLLEKKLEKKINKFFKEELILTKTEFIDIKTVKSLERIKQETNNFLNKLTKKQKKEWVEREIEKFITNTNAIEGSTLTLKETHRILKLNEKLGSERERLEVINMEKCLQRYDDYLKNNHELNEVMILQFHLILLNEIPDYDKYKGIWRPVDVEIRTSKYEFPRYEFVPSLMKKLLKWFNENKKQIHAVELAAKFHTKFTTIHPFADGNGRIARLLMNYILQTNEFPFTNIPSKKTEEYFETQEKGHKSNYEEFTKFLTEQMKKNYKELKKEHGN